uniref:Uncharacterized protein n=1 Tax=Globodera rostochiensis TaxID=31243 RepID=A0A914GT07_GLORO
MPFSSFSSPSNQQNNGQQQSSSAVRKRQQNQPHNAATHQRALGSKVVVLGNMGVGKTSILLRHDGQGFTSQMSSTLGASYICSRSKADNGREFELQIWDTAGQERFRSMNADKYLWRKGYAEKAQNLTNYDQFPFFHHFCVRRIGRDLESWIKEVERIDETGHVFLFVVANKCDLNEMRMVSEEEGRQFAEKQNAHYCETSALSGKGIETVMSAIAECILQEEQRLLKQSLELGNSVFDLASPAASEETDAGGAKGRGGGRGNGKGCCAIL